MTYTGYNTGDDVVFVETPTAEDNTGDNVVDCVEDNAGDHWRGAVTVNPMRGSLSSAYVIDDTVLVETRTVEEAAGCVTGDGTWGRRCCPVFVRAPLHENIDSTSRIPNKKGLNKSVVDKKNPTTKKARASRFGKCPLRLQVWTTLVCVSTRCL